MFFSLDSIINLLSTYKYALLFPISIVEGPVVSVIAGFLSAHGFLNLFITYAVLIAGDIVGDTMYYSIGRWGGRPFIRKWGKYFGIKEDKVLKIEKHFEKHAGKTLLIGKTQAIGGLFLAAAGLSKMPYWKFIWFNFIGTIPKSAILLAVGFFIGNAYKVINNYLGYYAIIATAIFLLIIGVYFFFRSSKKASS